MRAGAPLRKSLQSALNLIQLKAIRFRNEHRRKNGRCNAINGHKVRRDDSHGSRLGADLPHGGRPNATSAKPRIVAANGS